MSGLMVAGNNMVGLGSSPEAMQGFLLSLAANAAGRRHTWDAMNRQLGHIGSGFDAHRQGQMDRRGGFRRANEAIFGGGGGSASSQLQSAVRDIGGLMTDRSADLGSAMQRAEEAFVQSDAMRERGTRRPGEGSAFEQAMANAEGADAARARGMEAGALGTEGIGDAMTAIRERYGEGLMGAGAAGRRAGLERDVGSIRGGAQDTVAGIRGWQAAQEQPKYTPMGDMARAFGPVMMRRGLGQARQQRQALLGGML